MPIQDKNDIRIMRTHKALYQAMSKILRVRNFKKITVLDLCEEAQIGRATFYAHFNDKYELLKNWLINLNIKSPLESDNKHSAAIKLNQYIAARSTAIKNLLFEADHETLDIFGQFCIRLFKLDDNNELQADKKIEARSGKNIKNKTVLNSFFAGGIINNLYWQIFNYFPSSNPLFNSDLLFIIEQIKQWE